MATFKRCNALIMRSVIRRSGAKYNIRTLPVATRCQISTFSSREAAELMVSAATPDNFKAETWSCIKATKGETTMVNAFLTSAGI